MSKRAVRSVKRVAVVTGTRAEYGVLRSTLHAIEHHPRLRLQLVVVGMHLLERFGHTIDDICADGWRIGAEVPMQAGDDSAADQGLGLGRGVQGISAFLAQENADIVVVLGDRIEALAGALAGSAMGRIVAHIHGGDVSSGDFDDAFRHSITKLAHVHFAATADAARRIRRLGERPAGIHMVGAPGLDRLAELVRAAGAAPKAEGSALVVHHAQGRSPELEGRVMRAILRAVRDRNLQATVVYPNTDRGHTGIISAINAAAEKWGLDSIKVVRSLRQDAYLQALISARVLVGNSSSGIIEAGTAGTAVVNVGDRQKGRLRAGPGIVDCGEQYAAIHRALGVALRMRLSRGAATRYGAGRAGARIARVLARLKLDESLRRKQITF